MFGKSDTNGCSSKIGFDEIARSVSLAAGRPRNQRNRPSGRLSCGKNNKCLRNCLFAPIDKWIARLSDRRRRVPMNSSRFDPSQTHASLLIRLRDNTDQQAWEEFHERYAADDSRLVQALVSMRAG